MHVLHVMASGHRGGGATHLKSLLPALVRCGCRSSAAVGEGPLAVMLTEDDLVVHAVQLMRGRLDIAAPRRLRAIIGQVAPDLVHYHGTRAAFFGSLARAGRRLPPAVYTVHGLAYGKEQGPMGALLSVAAEGVACAGAARVITVSRREGQSLVRWRLVKPDQVCHVPNAIDPSPFALVPRDAARARLGLRADRYVIGVVARLVPQKGVADLIDAVVSLADVTLVVAGDGPLGAHLKSHAEQRGAQVLWLGERDDVAAILPAFDVFVLSSRWEAEGIALLEAMAAGVPCVATATLGAQELLRDTGAGLVVPIGSAAELARAITRLRANPALAPSLVAAGRALVTRRSVDAMAAAVQVVYGEALGAA